MPEPYPYVPEPPPEHVDRDHDRDAVRDRPIRPPHLSVRYLGLVFVGGAVGTCARFLITTEAVDRGWSTATATLVINLVGCLLIGVLLESLARRGPDRGGRLAARLLLGTGLLGGFTTYSTLAEVMAATGTAGDWPGAVGYGAGSLVAGLAACAIGVALGVALGALARRPRSEDPL